MTEDRQFFGSNQKDAFDQVKREFGDGAIILSGRFLPDRKTYEVTARGNTVAAAGRKAIAKDVEAVRRKLMEEQQRRRQTKDNARKLTTSISMLADEEIYINPSREPYDPASSLSPISYRDQIKRPRPATPRVSAARSATENESTDPALTEPAPSRAPIPRTAITEPVEPEPAVRAHNPQVQIIKDYNVSQREISKTIEHFNQVIRSLAGQIEVLTRKIDLFGGSCATAAQPELEKMKVELASRGLCAAVIQDLANRVHQSTKNQKSITAEAIRNTTIREIRSSFSVNHMKFGVPGDFELVAILGPSGCGKTTTLVKLARLLLKELRMTVGIATMDSRRVGAKEQIEKFARVLDIPVMFAGKPADMDRPLTVFAQDRNIILFDTPGFTPNTGKTDIQELKKFLQCIRKPMKKLLLLPATWKTEDLRLLVKAYEEIGINGYICTCIDETASLGNLYNLMHHSEVNEILWTSGSSPVGKIYVPDKENVIERLLGSGR